MKKFILMICLIIFYLSLYSQETYLKTFDYNYSKDAKLFYMPNKESRFYNGSMVNQGENPYLDVTQWTWDGNPGTEVSLIYFDISEIPKNTKIIKATLELHEAKSKCSQRTIDYRKSREFKICRITQPWKEDEVIWNNKPDYTSTGVVIVGEEDNLQNIDITEMIQEWANEPKKNYGMYLETTKSDYYRGIIFASSENENISMRPVLKVTFETNKKIKGAKEIELQQVPEIHQTNNCNNNQTLIIIDNNLDEVVKISNFSTDKLAEIISKLDKGKYIVEMIDENQNVVSFKLQK